MNKPMWFCKEFGFDGFVFVAVDMVMPNGSMFGMRHAIQPMEVDANPMALVQVIAELSESVARLSAPTRSASRACAFTPALQEQQR